MSITTGQYRRALYHCQEAAEALQAALRPDNRGRPGLHPPTYLVGMCLSMQTRKSAKIQSIHRVLTEDLPLPLQWDLGVLSGDPEKPTALTLDALYNFTRTLKKLDYGLAREPHLTDEQRTARHDQVQGIVQALLRPTLLPRPEGSADYAVDGTGIDAPERGRRRPKDLRDEDGHEEDHQSTATGTDADTPSLAGRGSKGASDAAWGWRTGNNGRSIYYGYDIEVLLRVPAISKRGTTRSEPALAEAMTVLPAGSDVVEPVLGMVDLLRSQGIRVHKLRGDRHYSYKSWDRWHRKLQERGVWQVCDLRADDQGFTEWNSVLLAAGWPHCPKTPDHLGDIPRPGNSATEEEHRTFNERITQRQCYAVQIVNWPTADNQSIRIQCPARAGNGAGCSLVGGTYAASAAAGLPVIDNPPQGTDLPLICQQETVTLHITTPEQQKALKSLQHAYWGSAKWQKDYARRTHVEGFFGCLQNDVIGTVGADTHEQRGLASVSIIYAMATAISNAHILRLWHEDTGRGDPKHPLLIPDEQPHGIAELTREEAQALNRRCAAQQAAQKRPGAAAGHPRATAAQLREHDSAAAARGGPGRHQSRSVPN